MNKKLIIAALLGWLASIVVSPSHVIGMFKGRSS